MSGERRKENYLVRVSKKHKTYFTLAKDFIDRMLVYTKIERKKIENVGGLIETDDKFICDGCGKCCDTSISEMAVDIYPVDLNKWMDEDFGLPLVSLGVSHMESTGEYSIFIDRKEDYARKLKFHTPNYIDDMVKLNPSLALINASEQHQCVFFNSLTNLCSVYSMRPLACKAFPYYFGADRKVVTYKKFCPKETFVKGEIDKWKEVAGEVLLMWSNIEGFKKWIKNRVGSTIYKDTDLDPQTRNKKLIAKTTKLLKSKKNQQNTFLKFCENLITTFYMLYSEYTNVGVIEQEMKKH